MLHKKVKKRKRRRAHHGKQDHHQKPPPAVKLPEIVDPSVLLSTVTAADDPGEVGLE